VWWQTIATAALVLFLTVTIFLDLFVGPPVNVLVWATSGEDLSLQVDGQPWGVLPAGTQQPITVGFRRGTRFEFRHMRTGRIVHQMVTPMNRSRLSVVPSDPNQCFVLTQVRPYWFDRNAPKPPRIVRRMTSGLPFDVAIREPWPLARVVLAQHEITVQPHERVDTLDEIPCALATSSDEQIIGHLETPGFKP